MLACGIVADIEIALSNGHSKSCERAVKTANPLDWPAAFGDGARDTYRFLSAGALVDKDVRAGTRNMADQLLFETFADALGGIFADSQAHGHERATGDFDGFRGRGRDPRRGVLDAKSFARPARGQRGQRVAASGSICAAFEKMVNLFGANGQQSKLGQPRIGIDNDAVGRRECALHF